MKICDRCKKESYGIIWENGEKICTDCYDEINKKNNYSIWIRDITIPIQAKTVEEAYEIFEKTIEPKLKEFKIDYDDIDIFEV